MKIVFRMVVLAALAALGVWLWLVVFPDPEKAIRKRLNELAATVSYSPSQGNLARIAAVQRLAGYFGTNVEVNIDVPGRVQHTLVGREEITQTALGARAVVSSLRVKFPDINVTVAPDKQSAVADVTLDATIAGEADQLVQELKFTMQKIDGRWLITRVDTIRTLSWRPNTAAHHFEL